MRTRQLSDLQNDVLFQLDEINSPKPVASDLTELLNQEWADIYDELIDSGEDYYLSQQLISIQPNVSSYAVDTTYYKTKGVDVLISGTTDRINAHRMQFEQRNDYRSTDWNWPHRILYAVWGNNLVFVPTPPSAANVVHWYAPVPIRMVNPGDTIDGVNGAELAMVYGAAQRVAMMLENWDLADRLGAKRQERMARILSTIRDRNIGEAQMARVVRGRPATRQFRGGWRS